MIESLLTINTVADPAFFRTLRDYKGKKKYSVLTRILNTRIGTLRSDNERLDL